MPTRKRSVWEDGETDAFRATVRRFFTTEVTPHREKWERQQFVDRMVWERAGELGLICASVPEEFGGMGGTFAHEAVLIEEQAYAGDTAFGVVMGSPMATPALMKCASREQVLRWMPDIAAGRSILAFGLTEPGAGSDAKMIRTTARREGDHYVLNGSKIFISNGYNADLILLAARTSETASTSGAISAFMIETRQLEGYRVGRILDKIGQKGQDTVEIFFDDVRVPVRNRLGEEGAAFGKLMGGLQHERTVVALIGVAMAERAIDLTLDHVKSREAFGGTLWDLQNTRLKLAECATKVRLGRLLIDECIGRIIAGTLDAQTSSMAKYWCTEMQGEVIDTCLQMFGGYGYMTEYPIARMYADARIQRIYGGANEIQKEVIARSL